MTLKGLLGLDDSTDPAAAMALDGGIASSGGPCGAIAGAALAVGILAEEWIEERHHAKLVARELAHGTMEAFGEVRGTVNCKELIGSDLRAPGQHESFVESGLWREACVSESRTVVAHLADLADRDAWEAAAQEIEATHDH